MSPGAFLKTRSDPSSEYKAFRAVIADQERTEMFPASLGQHATANNGFLLSCQLVFGPGAAARPIGDAAETSIADSSVGLASAL